MNTACPRPHAWRSYAFGLGLLPLAAQAEFLADSSANLDLRNFYQLRDYRQRRPRNRRPVAGRRASSCACNRASPKARSASAWTLPVCSA